MSYEMTPLVMHCVYPFPKEGIPCPACGRIQKKPSLFNLHAKNVHHTLAPETPTTCTGCGRQCRSYKAASAHYSRAHSTKRKSRSPSPTSSRATSPSNSPPPQPTNPPAPRNPQDRRSSNTLPLAPRKRSSPTCTPTLVSPTTSTQEIIRNFLQDLVPTSPPPTASLTASIGSPTPSTPTTSSPTRLPEAPASPIPLHSRRSITQNTSPPIDDFLRTIRNASRSRGPTSPASSQADDPSTSATQNNNLPSSPLSSDQPMDKSDLPPPEHLQEPSPIRPATPTGSPNSTQPPATPLPATPLPNDQRVPANLNDSQDVDLPESNNEHLAQFHLHWTTVLSSNLPWDEFSEQCVVFADAARTLAIQLSKPTPNNHPPVQRPNPNPPRRRPRNGSPIPALTLQKLNDSKDSTEIPRNVRQEKSCPATESPTLAPNRPHRTSSPMSLPTNPATLPPSPRPSPRPSTSPSHAVPRTPTTSTQMQLKPRSQPNFVLPPTPAPAPTE